MTKIRLVTDVIVEDKHDMHEGRELEVLEEVSQTGAGVVRWWVAGFKGERVGIYAREAEVI